MVTLINGVRRGKLRKDEDTMPIVAVYFSLLEALLEVYYLKLAFLQKVGGAKAP